MAARTPPEIFQPPPVLRVTTGAGAPEFQDRRFTTTFRIGRAEDCELRVQNEYVSRYQAQVLFEGGQWRVRDLGSSNGIYVGDSRVQEIPITPTLTIRLGIAGPEVAFEVEQSASVALDSTAVYAARYFKEPAAGEAVGEHTQMVRRAFQQVQKKQKRKYHGIVAGLILIVAAIGGYAFYQHQHIAKQTAMAKEIFYAMKSLDVDIASLEKLVQENQNQQGAAQVTKYRTRQKEMEKSYDRFLTSLRVYDPKMTEDQRLILRMARVFGECELDMPKGFVEEVQNYIKKWQSSGRLANAIQKAEVNGYTTRIANELLAQNLPPQFFYLALQESDFDPFISGPPTYKGIAKGMWQFIPETAAKYGLRIGPLADFRRPDVADDRHNWEKATSAASRYLKDIYSTDAQASGLLVIASYNWGEHRIVKLLQSMPANPRDRNFWKVLTDHRDKWPQETYDYVYYIFSAAVIGENPKLFGFKFGNPLAHLEAH
ncbi:MAG TPA: FHA domain-containing protein [Bryobacteraceae bacterium]|nr:FHA domain-containing protein [Bryobacteraceae bacterium]